MKSILKGIGIIILMSVMFYLMIAFYYLDINPKNWATEARCIMSILFLISVVIGAGVYASSEES